MKTNSKKSIEVTIKIAILGAVAAVLMLLEFPVVMIAPAFYELDFSEVVVLLGGFALGPWAAVAIEAVKIGINLLIRGSNTLLIGELANFIIGCSLVVPAVLFYHRMHSRKGAIIGMALGTVLMSVVGCLINAYLLLPTYAWLFNVPLQSYITAGSAINGGIKDILSFVVLAVAPFNLLKGVLVSLLTGLTYKRVSPLLKWHRA